MVSAIILSYNRCNEVLKTIGLLKEYKKDLLFDLEIIVVDNASVDNTSFQVKQNHPDVKLITRQTNIGIAGWNEGFKVAINKYMLVLDDDSCINSGLEIAIDYLDVNRNIGILALNVVGEHMKGDPDLKPEDAWKNKQNIIGFIGCGAIIRKELYSKIGGYAEWIYVYTHEFEYAIRCLNAGYIVQFFEEAFVVHRSSNVNRSNKRIRIFATRNEMGIVYKYFTNYRLKYLVRILVNNLKFIKREGLLAGWYVLQGAIQFLKLKSKLQHSPVSSEVQKFYAENFWSTKPVFAGQKKRIK